MPLPLPALDDRRWTDLVEEARALIPRHAPGWTDHNVHDPGVALIELFAWLVEQDIYRTDRVPESHRRKFLALAGTLPRAPQAAEVALTFSSSVAGQTLPAGVAVAPADAPALGFQTEAPLMLTDAVITHVEVFDGADAIDVTPLWADGAPFPLWGPDPDTSHEPDEQPALHILLSKPLPVDEPVTFWFSLEGSQARREERVRIRDEGRRAEDACRSAKPRWACPDAAGGRATPDSDESSPTGSLVLEHHGVRPVWEYHDGTRWQSLDPRKGEVVDDTRSFTLSGAVVLSVPGQMALAPGSTSHRLRCRLTRGRPDVAPVLRRLAVNTVLVNQIRRAWQRFTIAAGVTPPAGGAPAVGVPAKLRLAVDETGVITKFTTTDDAGAPQVDVFEYEPATAVASGSLTITLTDVGRGNGLPRQVAHLPDAPVAEGRVDLWSSMPGDIVGWGQRRDLDASTRTDAHFVLDATSGDVTFGDGERGRVVPAGAAVLASYETTSAEIGNLAAKSRWRRHSTSTRGAAVCATALHVRAGGRVGGTEQMVIDDMLDILGEISDVVDGLNNDPPLEFDDSIDTLDNSNDAIRDVRKSIRTGDFLPGTRFRDALRDTKSAIGNNNLAIDALGDGDADQALGFLASSALDLANGILHMHGHDPADTCPEGLGGCDDRDPLFLNPDTFGSIFTDGFESGDISAWGPPP